MLGIKNMLLALLIGLAVGGAGGFWGGWELAKADIAENQLEQVTEARKDDANAVADSQRETNAIAKQVASNQANSTTTQREARRHVERSNERANERAELKPATPEGESVRLVSGDEHLGVGLVCVLNAARTNRAPDCPAAGSDEAGGETPDATVSDFIENDLEVVRMYHDLAVRHAALVQFVLDRQAEQREDMGIMTEETQSRLNDIYR